MRLTLLLLGLAQPIVSLSKCDSIHLLTYRHSDRLLAFDNNEPIRSSRDDQPYQLSVQVARNTVDIEQQQEEVERVRKEMRACIRMIVVVGIFAALAFLLYGHATKM